MILISHRGNIYKKIQKLENNPDYIDSALNQGFDVEIDIRFLDNKYWLGHDFCQFEISLNWIKNRKKKLWIHCKNHAVIEKIKDMNFNFFWHDDDDLTITSKGYFWSHPKIKPIKNSIAVLPENHSYDLNDCLGICSDNILKYQNEFK